MKKLFLFLILMNLNLNLNPNHLDIFKSKAPELLVYGGAGAGKTYSIADKLLLNQFYQPQNKIKIVVIRKTFPALRNTALNIIESRASLFGLPFVLNKSDWAAKCNNLTFIFQGLNGKEDFEKLKSLTDVDYIWFNELPEVREDDYDEALRRLRGGYANYEQIVSDFNPIGKTSWVYRRFWEKNVGNVQKLRYTVMDNHPSYLATDKAKRYIERLRKTKEHNINLYNIYFLGEWGELEGVIYEWDVVKLPKIKFDEIFYGGDFGYSVDPAALVRIYRKADEYWLEEVLYETGLTNIQMAERIKDKEVKGNQDSYWDCAEPKSIQELYDLGINAYPCAKGADSVRAGIDFLKEQKIHIVEGSENIVKEQRSYIWKKDKDGNALNVPVEFNNHTMSAIRYGIHTHMKDGGATPGMLTV